MDQLNKDYLSKMEPGLLKEDAYQSINASKVSSSSIYAAICQSGAWLRYPETTKLFKLALLILPFTPGVERGFSVMNQLVPPFALASITQMWIDRGICV